MRAKPCCMSQTRCKLAMPQMQEVAPPKIATRPWSAVVVKLAEKGDSGVASARQASPGDQALEEAAEVAVPGGELGSGGGSSIGGGGGSGELALGGDEAKPTEVTRFHLLAGRKGIYFSSSSV